MEKISGRVNEDDLEELEELVDNGKYENLSEALRFSVHYTLSEKHGR